MYGKEILKPCPFCGGKAVIERIGTHRQSSIVTCEDCGCTVEGPDEGNKSGDKWNRRDALSAINPDAIRAEARAELDELKKRIAELEVALENLQFAESRYRYQHDALGDGDIKTGMAWDSMKKRGDEARAALADKE